MIRPVCSRSSGTCSQTRSSSRRRADACGSCLRRAGSQAEIVVEDNGAGIRPEFLPSCLRSFPAGRRLSSAAIRWSWPGTVDRQEPRAVSRRDGDGLKATAKVAERRSPSRSHWRRLQSCSRRRWRRPHRRKRCTDGVSLAGIRVLVVEDEVDAAEFVKQLLESYGAVVVIATSAREALDVIATSTAGHPDQRYRPARDGRL